MADVFFSNVLQIKRKYAHDLYGYMDKAKKRNL